MPKILNNTPAWLLRPSPGAELFNASTWSQKARPDTNALPRRTITRRNTEVFVALGNQLRWADLALLKHQWEARADEAWQRPGKNHHEPRSNGDATDHGLGTNGGSYRVLKVPVWEDIRQLIISPVCDLMAILTSHTVHVVVLPDPSHLRAPDTGPLRLKYFTVGPTIHVLSQPRVVSAIWHPLGVLGHCLVTVTADSIVRVWEFSLENRWSFDRPSLAIDLKRLADGLPQEADLGSSRIPTNKGFSLDSIEMEVAAACFGASPSGEQEGWAPMTLWVAMREGDVYALCPLLPTKWSPTSTLIPSLSVSIVSNAGLAKEDPSTSDAKREMLAQQLEWISDIDNQDPVMRPVGPDAEEDGMVYSRPAKPEAIPKLQGPFELLSKFEDNRELLTDIYAVGSRSDYEDILHDEDESAYGDTEPEGLSIGVICLLTSKSRVHVLLDLEGIEGQWFSNAESESENSVDNDDVPSLLNLESINLLRSKEIPATNHCWPLFTPDPYSPYLLFATHGQRVTYLSLSNWVKGLEPELHKGGRYGAETRLDALVKSLSAYTQRVVDRIAEEVSNEYAPDLSACIVIQDSLLGYFLLTASSGDASAVLFDVQYPTAIPDNDRLALQMEYEAEMREHYLAERRPPYAPPPALWTELPLPAFLEQHMHGRQKRVITEEIRFSQLSFLLLTEAHNILSQHTHLVGAAAAELFRQCERMQEEFRSQIRKVDEMLSRVESVIGEDGLDGAGDVKGEAHRLRGEVGISRRIEDAKSRQTELAHRYDALQRKIAMSAGRELSDREKAWKAELQKIESSMLESREEEEEEEEDDGAAAQDEGTTLARRYREIKHLTSQLVAQAKETAKDTRGDSTNDVRVPSTIRKKRVEQVMQLLERETALVDATKDRLERLTLSAN